MHTYVHGYGYGQPMLAIADTAYNGGYGAPAYGVPGVMPGYGAPYNPGYAMPPQY
jgi:hypothetical protein